MKIENNKILEKMAEDLQNNYLDSIEQLDLILSNNYDAKYLFEQYSFMYRWKLLYELLIKETLKSSEKNNYYQDKIDEYRNNITKKVNILKKRYNIDNNLSEEINKKHL